MVWFEKLAYTQLVVTAQNINNVCTVQISERRFFFQTYERRNFAANLFIHSDQILKTMALFGNSTKLARTFSEKRISRA